MGAGLALAALVTCVASGAAPDAVPVTWSVSPPTADIEAGGTLRVALTARIEDGWHVYALSQTPPPDPTRISVTGDAPFSLKGPVDAPAPESGYDESQGADTEYYTDAVTFSVPVAVAAATTPGQYHVRLQATWQACNGTLCLRPQTTLLDVAVRVAAHGL